MKKLILKFLASALVVLTLTVGTSFAHDLDTGHEHDEFGNTVNSAGLPVDDYGLLIDDPTVSPEAEPVVPTAPAGPVREATIETPEETETRTSTPTPTTPTSTGTHDPSIDISDGTFNVLEVLKLPKGQPGGPFQDPNNGPLVALILTIINYALSIFGSLAIIMFIIIGFMFMFAQGNQQKIDNAKEFVKFTIIGIIATFLSYVVIIFIQSLFSSAVA